MVKIIEKHVQLDFPLGHHLHCLIAQIPNRLKRREHLFTLVDPEEQWHMVQSVLDLVASGEGNLKRLHFLMFPETSIPVSRFDQMLSTIEKGFRPNTVTMFGLEQIPLEQYRNMLIRFHADNTEALQCVEQDVDSGDIFAMPVNWCCIAVKEASGKLRVFLEAKTHPFRGEEFLDKDHDLYRGRYFYLVRAESLASIFMWMSSRETEKSNSPASILSSIAFNPVTMDSTSAIGMIPCFPSMVAWAMEPRISW